MAESKKSFILYCDLIHTYEKLTDEQAGQLIKHTLRYVNDANPVAPDIIIDLIFEPIKQQLKRDLNKWQDIRGERSKAGKLSAEKRKQMSTLVDTSTQDQTHDNKSEQGSTNSTVNVSANATANVNDNASEREQTPPQFEDYCLIGESKVYLDGEYSKADTENYLMNDPLLIEHTTASKCVSKDIFDALIKQFIAQIKAGGKISRKYGASREHYISWINSKTQDQLPKLQNNTTTPKEKSIHDEW